MVNSSTSNIEMQNTIGDSKKPLSLYIHWPFCISKCPYCDFNSHVQSSVDQELWLKAFLQEVQNYQDSLGNCNIRSVFFGGGTPSLMSIDLVSTLLQSIDKISSLNNAEITLEVNPTSAEAQKLKQFAVAGINRLSIGVQALKQEDLEFLGRNHNVTQAQNTIDIASKYFKAYSFDLIYARPKQTLEDWRQELMLALNLAAGHISLYQLTIEKGTPFYSLHKNKIFTLPEPDIASAMYDLTREILTDHGYAQYEISNYAKYGQECRHNLAYWNYDEYLGIGPGAHSRIDVQGAVHAISMYYSPQKWLNQVLEHGTGLQHDLILNKEEIKTEIIMMGLRLNKGIEDTKLRQYLRAGFQELLNQESLLHLQQLNLIELTTNRLKLTEPGLLLHDAIVKNLL